MAFYGICKILTGPKCESDKNSSLVYSNKEKDFKVPIFLPYSDKM